MRRCNGVVLVAGTVATLLLTGCGQIAPTVTALTSPSATVPTRSPGGSPTPTSSESATPTASPTDAVSATPTPSPTTTTAKGLVLAGSGVGGHEFGAAEAEVVETLASALGNPDESVQGVLCELDSGSPWQRSVIYDGLSVMFTAKSAKKSAARTLNSWSLSLDGGVPKFQLEDDIPLDLSFKQLKAKYPKGKLTDTGLGDDSQIFTLPNGIRFVGVDVPDMVMAGELHYCE